jgi:hypothetical protein
VYTRCALCCWLSSFYIDIVLLTSARKLLPIIVASGETYISYMCVLGLIFGGCNCRAAVDHLVSALLLCLNQGHIH